jgi:2,3,4,5-tetrahydropyridine-2-carboxylate N-succinyltransferase
MQKIKSIVEEAFHGTRAMDTPEVQQTLDEVIRNLEQGKLRVANPQESSTPGESLQWQVQDWVKQAILLYFRVRKVEPIHAGDLTFLDKIPLRRWTAQEGVRVVPPALVRVGAYVARGAILMPSYVNIGAYVGEGTMVDTWATVGSCAQIGRNVHLSGGVGIGGVLEPIQAAPVIIEDDAFIGSRCIVVEGVHVRKGAVLGAGVVLTASTKILDVTKATVVTYRGEVPENAVVIPGSIPKEFAAGTFSVPCALIIGRRTEQTDKKTSLTAALRDFEISV